MTNLRSRPAVSDMDIDAEPDYSLQSSAMDLDEPFSDPIPIYPEAGLSRINKPAIHKAKTWHATLSPVAARTPLRELPHSATQAVRSRTKPRPLKAEDSLVLHSSKSPSTAQPESNTDAEKDAGSNGAPSISRQASAPASTSERSMQSGHSFAINHYNYASQHAHYAPNWLRADTAQVWVSFVFRSCLSLLCIYILLLFLSTILKDVSDKVSTYSSEIREEITACARNYQEARCGTHDVVSFSLKFCEGWKLCMERDPGVIGRARVGAETFGEVINGFVDVISWKTLFFLLSITAMGLYFTQSAISHRPQSLQHHYPIMHHPQQPYYTVDQHHGQASQSPNVAKTAPTQRKGWLSLW